MPADIRDYLLDRFKTDATTLRLRADSLRGAHKPSPGPDAALSAAMANACDNVVALAEQLPENAPVDVIVDALKLMVPKLTELANSSEALASPALRSVYLGASTRALELIAAETTNQLAGANDFNRAAYAVDEGDESEEHFGSDDFADDDDVDDDDPYD